MGNDLGIEQSYDLETYAVSVCVECGNERSVFGNIIGDIIAPVKSIIMDAFNEFKGPVGDIVQFVMSNVLSGLITFIADAVEDIFPGLGYVTGKSVSILEQLMRLVPVAAALLEAAIKTFMSGINSLFTDLHSAVESVMQIVVTSFGDFTKICNTALSKMKLLVAKTSTAITVGVGDLSQLGDQLGTDAINAIEVCLDGMGLAIKAIPTVVFTAIGDGASSGAAALITVVNALTAIVTSLVESIESIVLTIVNTIGAQIDDALQTVQNGVEDSTAEIVKLLAFAQDELAGAGGATSELVGACIHGGNVVRHESRRVVGEGAIAVQKGLGVANEGAKGIITILDDIITSLEYSQHYIAGGLLVGTLLIAYMTSREISR